MQKYNDKKTITNAKLLLTFFFFFYTQATGERKETEPLALTDQEAAPGSFFFPSPEGTWFSGFFHWLTSGFEIKIKEQRENEREKERQDRDGRRES